MMMDGGGELWRQAIPTGRRTIRNRCVSPEPVYMLINTSSSDNWCKTTYIHIYICINKQWWKEVVYSTPNSSRVPVQVFGSQDQAAHGLARHGRMLHLLGHVWSCSSSAQRAKLYQKGRNMNQTRICFLFFVLMREKTRLIPTKAYIHYN
jgi:hypothetical protein